MADSDYSSCFPELMGVLGNAKIDKVYEYYDRPVLFSCLSQESKRFIAVLADEQGSQETWLVAPITRPQLDDLEAGKETLRDAFLRPRRVYLVVEDSKLVLDSATVDDELLPKAGVFLRNKE